MDIQLMQDYLHARTSEFQKQIAETHKFIDFVLSHVKNPYVAVSFGKDSVVMLHLVLQHRPYIPVYSFSNKQYDFPDTHRLRWELQKKWDFNLILVERNVSRAVETEDEGGAYNRLFFAVLKDQVKKHGWDCAFCRKTKRRSAAQKKRN